jgi:hypothetical protein
MIDQVGHRRIFQTPEVMKGHPDRIVVRPRIEFDEFVMFKLHITVDGSPKMVPNGGIAPTSQPGNSFLNSRSLAIRMFSDRVMNFRCRRSTFGSPESAILSRPSVFTITVFAISLPGI